MSSTTAAGLLEKASRVLTTRHYSRKTIKAYLHWMKKFLEFHSDVDPYRLREPDVNAFLSYLAVQLGVSSSTQTRRSLRCCSSIGTLLGNLWSNST